MALNLSQKQNVVAEVAEIAAKAHSLIAAEYIGTTVSQMTAMRSSMKSKIRRAYRVRLRAPGVPRCGGQAPGVQWDRSFQ